LGHLKTGNGGELSYLNSWDNKARAFEEISSMLRAAEDPKIAWQQILEITKQSDIAVLSATQPLLDIRSVTAELRTIFTQNPLPSDLSFCYFGLVDLWNEQEKQEKAGFYVAGGKPPADWNVHACGKIFYFPKNRWLSSTIPNDIKKAEQQRPERREFLGHAVMFGGARVIAKFAMAALDMTLPVYVGFDSGDFELVSG
jgi:hypothetical protein